MPWLTTVEATTVTNVARMPWLDVMGGGGGKSPLPFDPNPLGELRVVPSI
jgi:hypothetical protein